MALAPAAAGLAAAAAAAAAPALAADSPAEPAAAAASFSLQDLEFPPPAKAALLVATGAVAGLASGLLGVGGGLIVTPLLAVAMPYAQATVLGTSLLSMIPPASAALVQHHRCEALARSCPWLCLHGWLAAAGSVGLLAYLFVCLMPCCRLSAGWEMLTGAWQRGWQPAQQWAA